MKVDKEYWVLEDNVRPWTMNAERRWHYHKRASTVKDCRERFAWLALGQKVPRLDYVSIDVVPFTKTRSSIADPAACYPAAKAAIDGLVDANVIEDDSGVYIKKISFWSPQISNREALRLVINKERKLND